jgi:hypothetical protein
MEARANNAFRREVIMRRLCLIAAVICLATPILSVAQLNLTLSADTARFVYFPPPRGSGVAGGVPSPFELHFGIQGSFVLTDLPGDQGDITQANFTLVGNETALANDPQLRADLETTAEQLLLSAPFTIERGPSLDRTVYRAPFVEGRELELEFFRQTLVRMEGGPDSRPVDGPAFQYQYPVAEPANLVLGLVGGASIGIIGMSRRRRSLARASGKNAFARKAA